MDKYCRSRETTEDNTIRRMCFVWWITKATKSRSEYVIRIAFPRQEWLCERAWMLCYTYIPRSCCNKELLRYTGMSSVKFALHYTTRLFKWFVICCSFRFWVVNVIPTCPVTQTNIQEAFHLQQNICKNLKSRMHLY